MYYSLNSSHIYSLPHVQGFNGVFVGQAGGRGGIITTRKKRSTNEAPITSHSITMGSCQGGCKGVAVFPPGGCYSMLEQRVFGCLYELFLI